MNLDSTKAMRGEHCPSGHPLNALIFPDQKCDVKMGCSPKRRKKKYESKGMSLNGDGLNNITFCFLKSPPSHSTSSSYNIDVAGTLYAPHSLEEYFPFLNSSLSVHQLSTSWKSIFIFFNCLYFCLFFSYILYLCCVRVTDVYKNTSPFCFPLSRVGKPTNPLQYLSTRQNFSTCRRNCWGWVWVQSCGRGW